jgi:signal transduction histidine kinase/CheY-like chemotaxis protein
MEECPIDRALPENFDVREHEDVFIRKNGQFFPVLVAASPIFDERGRPASTIVEVRDITERKEAEARLRDEAETIRTINRIGQTLVSELDHDRLVQALTDAATELTGAQFGAFFYNVVDPRGESYVLYTLSGAPREAFAQFPMPRNTAVFGPTFRNEGVVRSDDITRDPRYGKNRPYHGMPEGHLPVRSYLAVSVVSRTGEVVGGLFFGHPEPGMFTERHETIIEGVAAQAAIAMDNARLFQEAEKARRLAEEASRLKDEFLATLSHELRTPLNAILGWTHLLRAAPADPEKQSKGLDVIERNTHAQTQIIEDLLDMSRIISGKIRLDVQKVHLAPVIEAAVESVRPAAEARDIRLQAVLDPIAGVVSGDPNRLQQVAWNLLTNAIKFTPKGGRVQVLLERVNSHVEMSVIDTGKGIAPEFLPHVFDRFRQEDSSSTRSHGGLGLGLAIVKQLVELHGGSVRANSPGEGQGATFAVSLPLTPIHPEPTPNEGRPRPDSEPVPSNSDRSTLAGLRVLVVDDDPDARELVKEVLSEYGAAVTAADSAGRALQLLAQEPPDELVSDIEMPGEDGYSLIRKLRALSEAAGGRTPAVALTAYARTEDRTRALMAGYHMHVAKPVEPAELVATIASLARR